MPDYLVYQGGEWIAQALPEANDAVKFNNIKFYYANVIDYLRLVLILIAAYTITTDWHLLSAFLILGATFLDLVDGPVARAYNQCTLFGSGIDWLADLLGETVITLWWARYDCNIIPWLIMVLLIEFGTGLFDFGTTTKLNYPIFEKNQHIFYSILDWSMPSHSYTVFGNFIWFAYPLYSVLRILEYCYGYNETVSTMELSSALQQPNSIATLFFLNRTCLLIPALLYVWCELAFGVFILRSWIEPPRKKHAPKDEIIYDDTKASYQGGFTHYKPLSGDYRTLIKACYEEAQSTLKDKYEMALSSRQVFWINVWKRAGASTENLALKRQAELDTMVQMLLNNYYNTDEVLLDGYGYLLNPTNSQSQPFHIDHNGSCSSLFVPLVSLSPNDSVQYIIPPATTNAHLFRQATSDCDNININSLVEDHNSYSVRQCVSKAFSVLKMDFGTIYRVVANQGAHHQPVFYISVIRKDAQS